MLSATAGTATGTIEDNAAPVTVSVGAASAVEGGKIRFTITLSAASGRVVKVKWNTAADTTEDAHAAGTGDYTAVATATEVEIAAGDTTKTVEVQTTQDTVDEHDETFKVVLSAPTHAVLSATAGTATGTITDDDVAPSGITLTASPDAVTENGGAKTVTVTATVNGATRYVDAKTVAVSVAGDTAGTGDFTAVADFNITIAAGAASQAETFTLTPTNDVLTEGNETIDVTGTSGTLTITPDVITITDDDVAPSGRLVLTPATISESGAGNSSVVTATLGHPSAEAVTLTVAASPGDGTVAADYALAGATLTIAAGETTSTGSVMITAVDNNVYAPSKSVSATASGGGVANPANQVLTISEDETPPSGADLSVSPNAVHENGGAKTITVTATVLGAARSEATVLTISVAPDTAQAADFEAVKDFNLTIPARATTGTATFTLIPVNDLHSDPGETVEIRGSTDLASYTVNPATLTINNYDPPATDAALTVSPESVAEDGGAETITVTARFGAGFRNDATEITVSVAAGTASVSDFAAVPDFIVTIPAGEPQGTATFTLNPQDDTQSEGSETVKVTGSSNVSELTIVGTELTIIDDDVAPSGITLTASPDAVTENGGAKTVTVTATVNGATRYVDAKTVAVSVAGDTAGTGDFTAVADFNITIAAGAASQAETFTLTPTNDVLVEGDETLDVTGASGTLTVTGDTITITDDDKAPGTLILTVSPKTVGEGDGSTTVTVTATVSGSTRFTVAQPVNLTVGQETDSAIAGEDYSAVEAFVLTIPSGAASGRMTFTLTPTDDETDEDDETLSVVGVLSGVTVTTALLTIEDDDDTSIFSITGATVEEGDVAGFTVTRTGGTGSAATIYWATVHDPVGSTPATVADYTTFPTPQLLSFAPGETQKQVDVSTTEDALDEEDETFLVRLSGASATVVIAPDGGEAMGTILDDDDPPELSIGNAFVEEGQMAKFPLTLSVASGRTITMAWNTMEATATEDIDYQGQSGIITIPRGALIAEVSVPTIDDPEIEAEEETFILSLSEPHAVTFARVATLYSAASSIHPASAHMTAIGTILDNDRAATRARLKRVNDALLPWVGSALLRRHVDRVTGCLQEAETGASAPDLIAVVEQAVRHAEARPDGTRPVVVGDAGWDEPGRGSGLSGPGD